MKIGAVITQSGLADQSDVCGAGVADGALVSECALLTDAQGIRYLMQRGAPAIGPCVLSRGEFDKNPWRFSMRISAFTLGRLGDAS